MVISDAPIFLASDHDRSAPAVIASSFYACMKKERGTRCLKSWVTGIRVAYIGDVCNYVVLSKGTQRERERERERERGERERERERKRGREGGGGGEVS